MAKASMKAREARRIKTVARYAKKRAELKEIIRNIKSKQNTHLLRWKKEI